MSISNTNHDRFQVVAFNPSLNTRKEKQALLLVGQLADLWNKPKDSDSIERFFELQEKVIELAK
jgi:hypothetical protein